MLKRLEMKDVFDGYLFVRAGGGRYLARNGWYPLLGLPGTIDAHRGAILFCQLQKPAEAGVKKFCLNGVIEKIRIHRSARAHTLDTMLVLASDLFHEFEVCQIPMMSDTEVEVFIGAIVDRRGKPSTTAMQPTPVGSEVDPPDPPEDGLEINQDKLSASIRDTRPHPQDQREQQAEVTNLEQSKALAAIMQDNLVKTPELREKQARLIELLKSGTKPELLDVLTDLLVGPTPEEQAEQEAAAEMLAKAYNARLSKKDQSTS